MSSFEFFPEERPLAIQSEADALLPGDIETPAFRGMGREAWAGPARGMVKLGEAAGLAAGAINGPIDSLLGTDLQDQAFGAVDRMRDVRESLTLRPGEVGVAARVIGGLGEFVTQLAVARSPGALASTLLGTSSDLAVAGVDPQTAVQAGTLDAAGLAVGLRIPTLGATLAQRAGFGTVANVAQGVVTRGAIGELLRSEGAPAAVTDSYRAWDAEALAVDALTGAVFGGLEHWGARADVAALNDHAHRVARTAPGEPVTADALDAHAQALDQALAQVLADEAVTVQTPPERFQDDGRAAQAQADTAAIVTSDRVAGLLERHVPDLQKADEILPPESAAALRGLYETAVANFDDFNTSLRTIAKEIGARLAIGPIKLAGKASAKIAGDYKGDASQIADLLRSTFELPTLEGAAAAVDRVRSSYPVVEARSRNWLDPGIETADGYRDAKFVIEYRGNLAEIQVNIPEMLEAKSGRGHELYNEREAIIKGYQLAGRKAPTLAERKEIRRITAEMQQLYGAAWEKFLARSRKKASVTALPPRKDSTGKGRPPGTSQATTASGPTPAPTDTGIPSTSQNIVSGSNDSIGANIDAASAGIVAEAPAALQGADPSPVPYTLEKSDAETEGLAGWRPRPGQRGEVYAIKLGEQTVGFLDVSIAPDGTARIEDIVADRGPGTIGLAGVRGLLRALREKHPEITTINGERVSGIRRGGQHGIAGTGVEVSVALRPQEDAGTNQTAEPSPALQGADGNASTVITERGLEVPVRYRLVDASALITSHTDALELDPRFPPELQPRDRTRAASEQQIAKIENGIRPELLGESVKASDGAPIVGADGVVESGNARTIALRRAYARGKAGAYREWLKGNAARLGLDPAAVDGMAAPVLVRVAQGARDRAEFARQANESAIATMSPGELARADAQRLGTLEGLATNEDGSINLAQSRAVVDAFLRDVVSPADLNTTTTAEGGLSQFGLSRLRNAIFARAYGDTELLQALTESLDSNVKNVLAGMVRAAPEVARLRDLQAEGARHPIAVFDDFAEAVREFQAMRRDGVTLAQREAQGGLFGDELAAPVRNLIAGLEENSRAPKRMAELLSHMARTVDAAGDPRQGGLFGDLTAAPDAAEVSNAAVARIRREYEVKPTADLFASPTLSAAIELAATRPDMTVINADGVEVPAAQALAEADAAIREAEQLAPGVDALAACALQQLATVA